MVLWATHSLEAACNGISWSVVVYMRGSTTKTDKEIGPVGLLLWSLARGKLRQPFNSVLTPQILMSEVFQVLATFPNKLPWIELAHLGILHVLCTKKTQAVRQSAVIHISFHRNSRYPKSTFSTGLLISQLLGWPMKAHHPLTYLCIYKLVFNNNSTEWNYCRVTRYCTTLLWGKKKELFCS